MSFSYVCQTEGDKYELTDSEDHTGRASDSQSQKHQDNTHGGMKGYSLERRRRKW
jgi:hypothetical protein